jgi:hypothetical protein
MPEVIAILAPGFKDDPARGELAISLTRITFPYLLLVTLVTLYGGMLNVMHRFASYAAAPIFLNLSMMATLALAAFFPGAATRLRGACCSPAFWNSCCWPAMRQKAVSCPNSLSQARRRRSSVLPCAGPCDRRLDGNADCAVRRHHHRDLPAGRRAVGAVLRGPSQPVADRRDRDCHRHRAAAGNVATPHRQRCLRGVGRATAGV